MQEIKVYALKVRPTMKFPIIAWCIMVFQKMKPWDKNAWSHNVIEFHIPGKLKFYVHSNFFKGVHIVDGGYMASNYKQLDREYLLAPTSEDEIYEWYDLIKNRKYDFIQLFGLALKALNICTMGLIGKNYRSMICSEVILHYLEYFESIYIGDPDKEDLVSTWDILVNRRS